MSGKKTRLILYTYKSILVEIVMVHNPPISTKRNRHLGWWWWEEWGWGWVLLYLFVGSQQ
jgi:hypothetical protein